MDLRKHWAKNIGPKCQTIENITIEQMFSVFYIPAPVIVDPLKDVLPVVNAPSKLALLKFTCRSSTCMCKNIKRHYVNFPFLFLY